MYRCGTENVFIKVEGTDLYLNEVENETGANDFTNFMNATDKVNNNGLFEDKKTVLAEGQKINLNDSLITDTIWIKREPKSDTEDCVVAEPNNYSQDGLVKSILNDVRCDDTLSPPSGTYTCHHCSHKTPSLEKLRVHIEFRHILNYNLPKMRTTKRRKLENPFIGKRRCYECRVCQEKYEQRHMLRLHHYERHRGEIAYGCDQCAYNGITLQDLRSHQNFKHSDEKPIVCGYCPFRTVTTSAVRQHLKRNHKGQSVVFTKPYNKPPCPPVELPTTVQTVIDPMDGKKRYKCDKCEYLARYRSVLVDHRRARHSDKKDFSCQYCPFKTSRKLQLRDHVIGMHTDERAYQCSICSLGFTRKRSLSKHYDLKHEGNSKKFTCHLCGFKVSYKDNLKRHVLAVHIREKQHSCEYCTFVTSHSGNLKRHILLKHSIERPLFCNICSYYTASLEALTEHNTAKHSNGKDAKHCTHCPYSTNRSSQLKKHIIAKHTIEKKFNCEKCDYKTALKHTLNLHVRNKHSDKTFQCTFCEFVARAEQALKYHVRSKHTKPVLKCEVCEFTAPKKRSLQDHLNSAHSKCKQCGMVAPDDEALMSHTSIKHSKEGAKFKGSKLKCNFCNYFTYQGSYLLRHLNLQHPSKNYFDKELNCEVCGFLCDSRNVLAVHIKDQHGISMFFCRVCPFTSISEELLEYHTNDHPSSSSTLYKCELCIYKADSPTNLREHMAGKHAVVPPNFRDKFQNSESPISDY